MNFNNKKPRPEHLETLIELLKKESDLTPIQVTKMSDLTLTATYGAIEELERLGKITTIRQNKTPKLRISLKEQE